MSSRRIAVPDFLHMPAGHFDPWPVAASLVGLGLGREVAHGRLSLVVAATIAAIALAASLLRLELVLMLWFGAILVDGRWLTYHKAGPLYVTEPLLALLLCAVVVRSLLSTHAGERRPWSRDALRYVFALSAILLVPAIASLLLRTTEFDFATARNAVLVLYVTFAVIAVLTVDLTRSYRGWFYVALVGPAIALLLVMSGHAGQGDEATSTGAIRVAAHTFVLAFGIAPIVLIAAAREGLIRPVLAFAGVVPFAVGLVFVNHRSAWLAFIAALAILFARKISPPVLVGALAVVVAGALLLTANLSGSSTVGEEVARAQTVFSSSDPNAQFRLRFWKAAMRKSISSPLIGNGFDPYPPEILPPTTVAFDAFPAPHNSFVGIGYRVGLIPLILLLLLLGILIRRGFAAAFERTDPRDRAICAALTAIVVYLGVTSAFNVVLEAPFGGPVFWTAVGLLAGVVFGQRSQT